MKILLKNAWQLCMQVSQIARTAYKTLIVFYIAGTDTVCDDKNPHLSDHWTHDAYQTVSSNISFILAMLLFPEVQRCGQEELDRVIGKGSLPTFTDRSNLPYINAIVKEVLR